MLMHSPSKWKTAIRWTLCVSVLIGSSNVWKSVADPSFPIVTSSIYLRPIALSDSPQSEEGEALRIAGGLVYASRFALISRKGGKVTSRQRFSLPELRTALPGLPDVVQQQFENLQRSHAPLQLGARTIRLDQPQVMGILNVTPDSFSDGGQFMDDPEVASAHASAMLEDATPLLSSALRKRPMSLSFRFPSTVRTSFKRESEYSEAI